MRLSTYSDYSLRVLMHAGLRQGQRTTVDDVADAFGISRHHLVKVVHDLGRHGHLETRRGVGGGFTLGRPADQIRVGDIIRLGEETDRLMDCEGEADRGCRLAGSCRLKEVLDEAADALFAVLDDYTLADLLRKPGGLRRALGIQHYELSPIMDQPRRRRGRVVRRTHVLRKRHLP